MRELIDFSQPVAVLLFAVLHFVPDADDPRALLAGFRDVMAPGSALALSHITDENIDEEAARAGRAVYQGASAPITPRSRAQIEGLFDGLDLLPPGVVGISHWPGPDPGGAALHFYGGVAVKPAGLPTTSGLMPARRCARPSGGRSPELAEEAPVVGPHELLDEPSALVEPEKAHEIPDDPCSVRLEPSHR